MHKRLLCAISVMLLLPVATYAQIVCSFSIGVNGSNQIPHTNGLTGLKPGFEIAIMAEHFITPHVGLEFGTSFYQKGENWIGGISPEKKVQAIKHTELDYFVFPLSALFKWDFKIGNNIAAVVGKTGVYFADLKYGDAVLVLNNSSEKVVDISMPGFYVDTDQSLKIAPRVKPLDWGYLMGVEFRFNRLGIGVQYQYGLSSIGCDDYYGSKRHNQTLGMYFRHSFIICRK